LNGDILVTNKNLIRRVWSEWRFTVLLVALIIVNLARMATANFVLDRFLADLFGAAFLLIATLSLCVERRTHVVVLVLGISATLLSMIGVAQSGREETIILMVGRAAGMLFLGFTIVMILKTLLTQPSVTRDHIAGAFCGYVLIGIVFAEAYCILEAVAPNSFHIDETTGKLQDNPIRAWMTLQYFSFTTLTTVGFGDVLPIAPLARALALWEAILGQFYLAVLVAGLVNLRATRLTDPK
jgi:hypothetical protein